jgi:hypothetical protein
MYYVILNHTTARAEILVTEFGNPHTFRDKKWALLSGEAELKQRCDVFEYIVVKAEM